MKSGTKKMSPASSKKKTKPVLDFLLKPVGRKQNVPPIEKNEMELFCTLLQSGLPFSDCIRLSFGQGDEILSLLESGRPFHSIIAGQSGRHMKQMGVLIELFDLDQALSFDARLQQVRTSLYGSLFHKSAYPLFIMAFASALIWFFSYSIVPAMMSDGGSEGLLLPSLRMASLVFWIVVLLLFALIVFVVCMPQASSKLSEHLFHLPLLKHLCSMECAVLFECAQRTAMSTRQMDVLIQKAGCFPFCSLLWRRWKKQMERGKSLEQCIRSDRRLDPLFIRFFEIGLSGSRMETMMQAYQTSATMVFDRKLKKISAILLYTAYGFVGVLALSVYQIMLEPLTMLESL